MRSISLSALLLLLIPTTMFAMHQSATGEWWASVPNSEQESYVDGFMDCYVYDAGLGLSGLNMTPDFWVPKISLFYQQHPENIGMSVANVLEKLIARPRDKNLSQMPGETTILNGKHATYDSDLWRTRFPEERIGFVEGYLSCQKLFNKPKSTFSKSDIWYVDQISRWYGLKVGTDEIDDRKAGAKIADVLYLYCDSTTRE